MNWPTKLKSQPIVLSFCIILSIYIFTPTVVELIDRHFGILTSGMHLFAKKKKRIGRYTVGLSNRANDCFANSDLQALAALSVLDSYLVEFSGDVSRIADDQKEKRPNLPAQLERYYPARLSQALLQFTRSLNMQVLTPHTISPWALLDVIQQIYKSRISRAQHDAHEMLHLLLETLQNENEAYSKVAEVTQFPFEGETKDTIKCQTCGYSPESKTAEFIVHTLVLPQIRSVSLSELLNPRGEVIEDYGCTMCRLRAAKEPEFKQYLQCPQDLPEDLENRLPKNVTSMAIMSTSFSKLPPILTLHLSRSLYFTSASRNACKVSFTESLYLYEDTETAELAANGLLSNSALSKVRVTYKLMAVIRHKGTHSSGHYECFRRKNLAFWSERQKLSTDAEPLSPQATGTASAPPAFLRTHSLNGTANSTASMPISTTPSGAPSEPSDSDKSSLSSAHGTSPSSAGFGTAKHHKLPYPQSSSASVSHTSLVNAFAEMHAAGTAGASGASDGSSASDELLPPSGNEWWKISDDRTWEYTTRDVLREEANVYILFYERQWDGNA